MRVFNAGIPTGFTVNSGHVITTSQPQPQGNMADLLNELARLEGLLKQVKPSPMATNSTPLTQVPMGRIGGIAGAMITNNDKLVEVPMGKIS